MQSWKFTIRCFINVNFVICTKIIEKNIIEVEIISKYEMGMFAKKNELVRIHFQMDGVREHVRSFDCGGWGTEIDKKNCMKI